MSTEIVHEAYHIGADDLPFVDIGDGNKLKVLQVKVGEGLWIIALQKAKPRDLFAYFAAQEVVDRLIEGLATDVPERHFDASKRLVREPALVAPGPSPEHLCQ